MSTIQHCDSFALELLTGKHDFSADTIKLALFQSAAALSVNTTAYAASSEISDSGYTAGGSALAVSSTYPKVVSHVAQVRFDTLSWTFSGSVPLRYGLIYNASKSNRAISVIDVGSVTVTGLFKFDFPLTIDPFITVRIPVLS